MTRVVYHIGFIVVCDAAGCGRVDDRNRQQPSCLAVERTATMSADSAMTASFYLSLLELRHHGTLQRVERALMLAVEAMEARIGYIELWNAAGNPEFIRGAGDNISNVQRRISRGIVRDTVTTRRPVVTSSALLDRKFHDLDSVRQHQVRSVVTAPVLDGEVIGIVYFERDLTLAQADVRNAELFAKELGAIARRLVARANRSLDELTAEFRASVVEDVYERKQRNATSAARELGVTRKTFYRIRKRK